MKRVSLSVVSLVLAASLVASADAPSVPFKVIVNSRVAGRTMSRDVLAQIYLGKVSRWTNDRVIAPVDLSSTSSVRQAFSEQILGMPVEAVKIHWMRLVTTRQTNQRPPLSKQADEDVIAFVASEEGGVGYVSLATPVPDTVREVAIQ